jgi:hypothetical protein
MSDWAQYEGRIGTDPKTGKKFIVQGGRPVALAPNDPRLAPPRLTEEQGKAQTYSRLMAEAERQYQEAVAAGYNPTDLRNSFASFLENLPFGGLDEMGALVRSNPSDKGRAAELAFADAQLKAMSGAASPEGEVKRNVRTLFPQPGETVSYVAEPRRAMRQTAFEAARVRAGQAPDLPAFPMPPQRLTPEQARLLPRGTRFVGMDGVERTVK